MYLVHFFKLKDLCKNLDNVTMPINANEYIKNDVIIDIKNKLKKDLKDY